MKDSRDVRDCSPFMREKDALLREAFSRRFAPFFLMPTMTARTPETHAAFWAQGRTDAATVNALRSRAGLPTLPDQKTRQEITWIRHSKHVRWIPGPGGVLMPVSEAIDYAVALDPDGPAGPLKPTIEWDDRPRYRSMGTIAESLGLAWGGHYGDLCHVDNPTAVVTPGMVW